jgi:ABC-type multidrug transport system fused ATPase/permease subunit
MSKRNSNQNNTNTNETPKGKLKDWKKIKPIFNFLKPYKTTLFIGFVFLLLSTFTSLLVPILSGKFLDVATGKKDALFTSITQVSILFGLVLITQAILSFFRILLFAKVSENAMADVRKALYSKILTLPIGFFEQRRVGELNSRISSDVSQLQDTLSFSVAEFIRQILTILIGTIYLFIQSTQLTLFMVATFPVLIIVAIVFGKSIRKMSKQTQDELANANIIVEETLQAIAMVKSFTNERFEVNRYRSSLDKVVAVALHGANFRGAFISFISCENIHL